MNATECSSDKHLISYLLDLNLDSWWPWNFVVKLHVHWWITYRTSSKL